MELFGLTRNLTPRGATMQRFNASRQLRMAAVAETAALRVLAAAPSDGSGLGDVLLPGREAGALVRAVAKRLRL